MTVGFYFDQTRCVGCKTCQIACKDRFDIQQAGARPRHVSSFETGVFPSATLFHLAVSCNHCEAPLCLASCPTGAIFQSDDGTVLIEDDSCTKCNACVEACPYGAPQVVAEYDGLIMKCDGCYALRQAGMNPVCVDSCAMRALDFGDVDELTALYGSDLLSSLPSLPDGGTRPHILIKAKEGALAEQFHEISL